MIQTQIGDKDGAATSYGNLGTVFISLGQYDKAVEYLEKALAIKIQIDILRKPLPSKYKLVTKTEKPVR